MKDFVGHMWVNGGGVSTSLLPSHLPGTRPPGAKLSAEAVRL